MDQDNPNKKYEFIALNTYDKTMDDVGDNELSRSMSWDHLTPDPSPAQTSANSKGEWNKNEAPATNITATGRTEDEFSTKDKTANEIMKQKAVLVENATSATGSKESLHPSTKN